MNFNIKEEFVNRYLDLKHYIVALLPGSSELASYQK